MNSTSVMDTSDPRRAAPTPTDAVQQIAPPFAETANDSEFDANPLWMVAIALACLFTLLACLVAAG